MSDKIIWKAATSRHDWKEGHALRRLLRVALSLGLVGPVSWLEAAGAGKKSSVALAANEDLGDTLLSKAPPRRGTIELSAGGSTPAPWEIFWHCSPYEREEGYVSGLNTLWLSFERSRVADRHQSDRLLRAFMELHAPDDTEYALIHPAEHWSHFAELHYERPVTIGPMFQGALWANFLGYGHLNEFDLSKLRSLSTQHVQWVGDRGLFVITAPELAEADAPSTEPELLRLTKIFREALRADSKWR
jgi:hypothetical protein